MNLSKNGLSLILPFFYIFFFVIFVTLLALEVNKKVVSSEPSAIPSLSAGQLESISKKLGEREKLNPQGPVDLTGIQFGKVEPFNP